MVILRFQEPFGQMPEFDAGLSQSSISYEPKENWIRVEASKISFYGKGEPPEVGIFGKLKASDEQMKLIYQLYFRCSHFR